MGSDVHTNTKTIGEAACDVLNAAPPAEKVRLTHAYVAQWQKGALSPVCDDSPPDRPARPEKPELLEPGKMPKRRGGGSDANRIALMHALAHIELNAIDLAWDMIARFANVIPEAERRAFIDDWSKVANDEARHFTMLLGRLDQLGAAYGDLPAHDGLWQAAQDTKDDLAARLALVPMVLEARGLDVTPATVERLRRLGDDESADILDAIYEDEISHVAAGCRWFKFICATEGLGAPQRFQALVAEHFAGHLKPPFNAVARLEAGMPAEFYETPGHSPAPKPRARSI